MNLDKKTKSITRVITIPNTSQSVDSNSQEIQDVNKRIADLESTIHKLQLELIDLTSQKDSSNQSSKLSIKPKPKVDSTMHFEHVSLNSEKNTNELTDNSTNVQTLNHQSFYNDEELYTMIHDLKVELQEKLQQLRDVAYVEDSEDSSRSQFE